MEEECFFNILIHVFLERIRLAHALIAAGQLSTFCFVARRLFSHRRERRPREITELRPLFTRHVDRGRYISSQHREPLPTGFDPMIDRFTEASRI